MNVLNKQKNSSASGLTIHRGSAPWTTADPMEL